MFEKADSLIAALGPRRTRRTEGGAWPGRGGASRAGERAPALKAGRAGDALRAVAWSELTARLNAARDLRLLLRSESQAVIAPEAASFGDAAARCFALIQDHECAINPDASDCSKTPDGRPCTGAIPMHAAESRGDGARAADVSGSDARDE
jgi:hypothetical protein